MSVEVDIPAVLLAGGAAIGFPVANNVQQGAAANVLNGAGGPFTLLLRLLGSPRWLLGSALALGALGLPSVALARGGVTLVQPILALGLVAALALESLRQRRPMRSQEAVGAVVVVTGVTLLLGWGRPGGGRAVVPAVQLYAALVLAGVGLAGSRWVRSRHASAIVMGAAGGAGFALDAVYLKGVANWADDLDALPALTSGAGFVVESVLSNVLVQRAYQRAPLRVALPAVTAADPLMAFVIGRLLLGERLQGGDRALPSPSSSGSSALRPVCS